MQLLTADIMQELIDFRNENNIEYDITVINNNIYLRFHCGEMFEVTSLKKGIIEEKAFNKYFNITKFTYNLSKKLINVIEQTEI